MGKIKEEVNILKWRYECSNTNDWEPLVKGGMFAIKDIASDLMLLDYILVGNQSSLFLEKQPPLPHLYLSWN